MTKDTTRPMTAEEYWKDKFPAASENNLVLGFADAYATYRLQFERRQHQNSWMPTEDEWRRFPEAKFAAMDSDGWVFMYNENPAQWEKIWNGVCAKLKRANQISHDWTKCKVARPEGV